MFKATIAPGDLVFPDRCLRCGAAPRNAYMMQYGARRAEVPLCDGCGRQRRVGRAARIALGLVLATAAVVITALLLEVVLPFPEDAGGRRTMGAIIALVLLGAGIYVTWVAVSSALRRHRLAWDPVWPAEGAEQVLAFRDAETARSVLATSSGLTADSSYRDSAAPPTPYRPKGDPLAWTIPVLLALGAGIAFATRWVQLHERKETTVTVIEKLFYEIGGRWGLLGFWTVILVALLATAWSLGRRRRSG